MPETGEKRGNVATNEGFVMKGHLVVLLRKMVENGVQFEDYNEL